MLKSNDQFNVCSLPNFVLSTMWKLNGWADLNFNALSYNSLCSPPQEKLIPWELNSSNRFKLIHLYSHTLSKLTFPKLPTKLLLFLTHALEKQRLVLLMWIDAVPITLNWGIKVDSVQKSSLLLLHRLPFSYFWIEVNLFIFWVLESRVHRKLNLKQHRWEWLTSLLKSTFHIHWLGF